MPTAEPIPQEAAREEIDLNETAKKQGLMTDDEFQAILDGVNQREDDTTTMVEDLDLTSRAVGEEEPELETPQTEVGESDEHIEEELVPRAEVPEPVAPPRAERPKPEREPEEEKDEDDGEEARYQEERKRKGKALIKKKPSVKRQRTANTGVVITEAVQRTPPSRREQSDSEYAITEESDSDSDISLENEECSEQQLPRNHRELVHPPVERLRYRHWAVDLTDDLVEEMKLFDSKKLRSSMARMKGELETGKLVREAGPSGHGRTNEPRVSEEVVPETEEAEQKEEAEQEKSEEEPSGNEEEELKEPPAPVPAPRRSRRNV
ncbi:neurofilament medium polypeptide-like [Salvia splendens]|uniref:neurofilament medium polypeptide-like n=1 Tax=Salvia splendens TaxID=180675 RepID=UPI001C27C476|nr:neurofilament medium polypeptide-like [Salvia splendens]